MDSEVAAIIPGCEDGEVRRRDICLQRRVTIKFNGNEVLGTVSVRNPPYDAVINALLFPYGKDDCHPELRFREVAVRS